MFTRTIHNINFLDDYSPFNPLPPPHPLLKNGSVFFLFIKRLIDFPIGCFPQYVMVYSVVGIYKEQQYPGLGSAWLRI